MTDWHPISTAPKDGSRFEARAHEFGDEDKPLITVDAHWQEDGFHGPGWYTPGGVNPLHLTDLIEWRPIRFAGEGQ